MSVGHHQQVIANVVEHAEVIVELGPHGHERRVGALGGRRDDDALGAAQQVQGDVLQLEADLFADDLSLIHI